MAYVVVALISYLIGSIPSGFLIARLGGVDIRKVGSGNTGATNVTRALGKKFGYPAFAADFCKGLGAVLLATFLCGRVFVSTNCELLEIAAAIFCVIGNTFPVWLKFRGGKGVATSAGLLFALTPIAMLAGVVIWVALFYATRYVSLASVIAAVSVPVSVALTKYLRHTEGSALLYFTICLAVVVILRHRSNLVRLIQGTEQRFEKRED